MESPWWHLVSVIVTAVVMAVLNWRQSRGQRKDMEEVIRPTEEKTDKVYHAVNSGRMERIEADVAAVKKWSGEHAADDEKRHEENVGRLVRIEQALPVPEKKQ